MNELHHLVLTRKIGQAVQLTVPSDSGVIEIWVTLDKIEGEQAKLAFDAPKSVQIAREEIIEDNS